MTFRRFTRPLFLKQTECAVYNGPACTDVVDMVINCPVIDKPLSG